MLVIVLHTLYRALVRVPVLRQKTLHLTFALCRSAGFGIARRVHGMALLCAVQVHAFGLSARCLLF